MRVVSIVVVAPLANVSASFAGPTDPPVGPVAPSYKTLDQANPGTPISEVAGNVDAAHYITAGGRYFLDRDLFSPGAGKHVIKIFSSRPVEIDFNGFSIDGSVTETVAALDIGNGIVTIHGGVIANWGGPAIVEGDSTLTVRNMTMRNIPNAELMSINRRTVIENCMFESIGGPLNLNGGGSGGVQTGISIRNCEFIGMREAISGPLADGVQIIDCVFTGVNSFSELTRVTLGNDALIRQCVFVSGGENGVVAGNGLRIEDCVFRGLNTVVPTSAISAGTSASVSDCTVTGYSGDGIVVGSHSIVRDCAIRSCNGLGINANSSAVISGNTLESNGNGIDASFGTRIVGNVLRSNGVVGIQVSGDTFVGGNTLDGDNVVVSQGDNVIDGNTFTDAGSGIELNATGNVVRRNVFGSTTITGTQGFTGNLVYIIRTGVDYLSSGPFDNLSY